MRRCPLCDTEPVVSGSRYSTWSQRSFTYGLCPACGLGLVLDPREDYENLYDEAYYEGRGADQTVDYLEEMGDPGTVRTLEWEGLAESLGAMRPGHRVLDFGGGLGGLTRFLRARGWDAWGYEGEGFAHDWMRAHDILCLDELPTEPAFDTVFAVEVMEHIVEPLTALRSIRALLRPGGRLVITTGNLARARQPLHDWTYASVPEVHVTFWTPDSWSTALRAAGFGVDASHPPLSPAVTQYKVLKSLPTPLHRFSRVGRSWRPVAAYVDRRYGVSEFPDGIAVPDHSRAEFFERLAPPPGESAPRFDDGWSDPDGDAVRSHLTYVDVSGWAWSDDLEEIHEESSRDHFIDVLTRNSLIAAVPQAAGQGVIADLGCSTGYLLEDLRRAHPQAQLVGVDVIASGLVRAHETVPSAALLLADVGALPIGDGTLDAVVSANMLEHVEDDVQALREIRRVLRPGGVAAFVVPYGARLTDYYDRFLGHYRRYGRDELGSKARRAGFDVIHTDHLGQLLFPPFWAVKKRNRLLRGRLEGAALQARVEADIAATGNSRLGEWACDLERAMVHRGVSLPVGIRELVVVRRPSGKD